jgi:polysaccharide deacetylase 2 family uncharacterized protein YibQ
VLRSLIIFWVVVAGVALGGIGYLQYLGPPPLPKPLVPLAVLAPPKVVTVTAGAPAVLARTIGTGSTLAPGAAIRGPISELLTAAPSNANWLVPQIGADGLTPMRAYSAGTVSSSGPQIAIMVAGLGFDGSQSQVTISTLPAAVSLAIDPYGQHIASTVIAARTAGHEVLLSLPLQQSDPAVDNAGNEALLVTSPITLDQPMLDWNLSQIQGYAGVTDAIGPSMGRGFMQNGTAKSWLMQELAGRGLFFIDAMAPANEPFAWARTADILIDPINAPQDEATQLATLVHIAKLQNAALGILLEPSTSAVQELAAWTQSLGAQGVTLVPVSALVLPPNGETPAAGPGAP